MKIILFFSIDGRSPRTFDMAEPSTSALLMGSRHVEGVALITSAALLFGILAAVVKSVSQRHRCSRHLPQ